MESTPRIVENGLVVWDEMFEERRVELPSDLAQCPDIFINVYFTTTVAKTEQRLGYIRLDLEDVVGFNHAPAFETLTRDPLDPKIAAVPGFLEYRLDFGKEANLPRTPRERIMHPPTRRFELRGHIYQARNLPSMDEDGLANPFAVVTLHGFAGQTKVSEPTCNPQWYETVRVELELPIPTPTTANILVRLYDQDEAAGGGTEIAPLNCMLIASLIRCACTTKMRAAISSSAAASCPSWALTRPSPRRRSGARSG